MTQTDDSKLRQSAHWAGFVRPPRIAPEVREAKDAQLLHDLLRCHPKLEEPFSVLMRSERSDDAIRQFVSICKPYRYGIDVPMVERFIKIASQAEWPATRERIEAADEAQRARRNSRHERSQRENASIL